MYYIRLPTKNKISYCLGDFEIVTRKLNVATYLFSKFILPHSASFEKEERKWLD